VVRGAGRTAASGAATPDAAAPDAAAPDAAAPDAAAPATPITHDAAAVPPAVNDDKKKLKLIYIYIIL